MLQRLTWQDVNTEGKLEMIRAVYEKGMSASQIAARIGGVTRNSIIGMYTRYADELAEAPLNGPSRAIVGRRRSDDPKPKRKIRGGSVSLNRLKADAIFDAPSGGAATVGLPLSMLRARQCKFPVNDAEHGQEHLFCGAEADGSWCPYHKALVYQPRTKAA